MLALLALVDALLACVVAVEAEVDALLAEVDAADAELDALLALEQEFGRTREFLNAPRTLDLDVLMYDDLIHHEHGLTIPHPQMHLRAFVLQPLLEIAPDCVIPGVGRAADVAKQSMDQQLQKLD